MMARKIPLEMEVDTTKATKNVDDLNESLEETNGLTSALDKVSGGAFSSIKSGVGGAVKSFKTLRGAIAATGIGLLLIAFTSLVSFFTKTERGAQKLRVITAALGAIMGVLSDVVVKVGEGLVEFVTSPVKYIKQFGQFIKTNIMNRFEGLLELIPSLGKAISLLFEGEFTEAAKVAGNAVAKLTLGVEDFSDKVIQAGESAADYAAKMKLATENAIALENRQNALNVANREAIVANAQYAQSIADLLLISENKDKSDKERLAAQEEAIRLTREQAQAEIERAEEQLAIIKQQNTLSESGEEDLIKEAEAEARVLEIKKTASDAERSLIAKLIEIRMAQAAVVTKLNADKLASEKEASDLIIAELERVAIAEENELNRRLLDLENFYGLREELINTNEELSGQNEEERFEAKQEKDVEKFEARLENMTLTDEQETELRDQFFQNQLQEQINFDEQLNNNTKKQSEESKKVEEVNNKARLNSRKQLLNGIASLFGEESAIGKAALIASQAIAVADIVTNTTKSAIINTANATAALPPPLNIPLIAVATTQNIISGIGAGVAISSIASQTAQSVGAFESGGFIPGKSFTGDNLIANVNSNEVILNTAQQKNFMDIANGVANSGSRLTEERVAEIAAQVVGSVPVTNQVNETTTQQRKVENINNEFTVRS